MSISVGAGLPTQVQGSRDGLCHTLLQLYNCDVGPVSLRRTILTTSRSRTASSIDALELDDNRPPLMEASLPRREGIPSSRCRTPVGPGGYMNARLVAVLVKTVPTARVSWLSTSSRHVGSGRTSPCTGLTTILLRYPPEQIKDGAPDVLLPDDAERLAIIFNAIREMGQDPPCPSHRPGISLPSPFHRSTGIRYLPAIPLDRPRGHSGTSL